MLELFSKNFFLFTSSFYPRVEPFRVCLWIISTIALPAFTVMKINNWIYYTVCVEVKVGAHVKIADESKTICETVSHTIPKDFCVVKNVFACRCALYTLPAFVYYVCGEIMWSASNPSAERWRRRQQYDTNFKLELNLKHWQTLQNKMWTCANGEREGEWETKHEFGIPLLPRIMRKL